MSVPFFKSKENAESLWGTNNDLVKVIVPESLGFLQAPETGEYWVPRDYAEGLNLEIVS